MGLSESREEEGAASEAAAQRGEAAGAAAAAAAPAAALAEAPRTPGVAAAAGSPRRSRSHTPPPRVNNWDYRAFLPMSTGRVFDFYEKVGDLGEGGFGDVWLARERIRAATTNESAGRKVAIKRVRKPNSGAGLDEEEADNEDAIVDFRTEIDLMKSLDHPSICRLLNVYEDAKSIFLIMEHIHGGELFDRLMASGNFGEDDAAQVTRQLASALGYCHSRGVVHRDIKPENVLVVDMEGDGPLVVKLIDFGFGCRILRGAKLTARVGTFLYTAPEALQGLPCDEKIDLWALGVLLFVLLSGNMPFYGADVKQRIVQGQYAFDAEEWEETSDGAKGVIRDLLLVDPAARAGAQQLLGNAWLASGTVSSALRRPLLQSTMNAMKNFYQQSSLRHLCAGVVARQLDEARLHELHATFTQLDADENGILSMAELKRLCEESGLANAEEFQQVFADVDMNGSGEIDYTEFVAACIDKRTKQQEDMCWSAFRVFDLDGNGSITHQELHSVVKSADMNGSFSPETLAQIWKELTGESLEDQPQGHLEGSVDFDHFLAALGSLEIAKIEAKMEARASEEAVAEERASAMSSAAKGLPIMARRTSLRGAPAGLPIAGRGGAPALPIGGRGAALPIGRGGGALPIAGRGYPPKAGGLPIAGRH